MKLEEFDYELPEELIAQVPIAKRDESRSSERLREIAKGPGSVSIRGSAAGFANTSANLPV